MKFKSETVLTTQTSALFAVRMALKGMLAASFIQLSGCAWSYSPVPGILYSDVKTPAPDLTVATTAERGTRIGRATCTSIFGLIAYGDCSIEAAMKDGNLHSVQFVDVKHQNVLGAYATYTLTVRGE